MTRGCAFWDPCHMRQKGQDCVYQQPTLPRAPQPQGLLSAGPVCITLGGWCSLISLSRVALDLSISTSSKAKGFLLLKEAEEPS